MPKFKIGVFGSAVGVDAEINKKAYEIGKSIGEAGCALVTGGCAAGLPYEAARGIASVSGESIAYVPVSSKAELKADESFPIDLFTDYVFVPEDFLYKDNVVISRKYRNIGSCASCDAGIIIGGRIGTVNEFTNLYDFGKVIGVLVGSGGNSDLIPEMIRKAQKDSGSRIIYESDPEVLVRKIINKLEE